MCGRFILIQDAISLKDRFRAELPGETSLHPSYNISPGQRTAVITGERPNEFQMFQFGLTPDSAFKPVMLIEARSEGEKNPTDDPGYTGEMGIFTLPAFRKPIHSQRCLVMADAYIEGITVERLNKPFLIYLRNKIRPFAMAGIWDVWSNPDSGELFHSFAIVTTYPNQLVARLPYHRMPVILFREDEAGWLSKDASPRELSLLMKPYPAELMNGFPIAPTIRNPLANDPGLIHPVGPRIFTEN